MIKNIHEKIIKGIIAKVEGVFTYGSYPTIRCAIKTPAIFLDLASMEPANDPGTNELAVTGRFEIRVVIAASDESAMQVRELAAKLAMIIHHNDFRLEITPAKIISIGDDGFSPEFEAYEVWMVEFETEFHLGDSVWDDTSITPETVYIGYAPKIGKEHEDKYIEL